MSSVQNRKGGSSSRVGGGGGGRAGKNANNKKKRGPGGEEEKKKISLKASPSALVSDPSEPGKVPSSVNRVGQRSESISSTACVICCHESEFYCVGECGHAVCAECGIRIRVLGSGRDCPICRGPISELIVVSSPHGSTIPSAKLLRSSVAAKEFAMAFESEEAEAALRDLLAHVCVVCKEEPDFSDFAELQGHMRRIHGLYYCSLCVEHLHLFSWERKTYRRVELARHEREGDPDDRSHRGHPACHFCRKPPRRFLDPDALYVHLRRDHFFCHFCDSDGAAPQFYPDYAQLAEHFKAEHFLCEEGDCVRERFTPAFRTKMELELHAASHKDAKGGRNRVLNLEWGQGAQEQSHHRGGGGERGRGGGGERSGRGASNRPLPYHRQRELEEAAKKSKEGGGAEPEEEELIPVPNSSGSSKIQSVMRVAKGGFAEAKKGPEYKNEARDFPRLGPGVQTSDGFKGFAGGSNSRRGDWTGRGANATPAQLQRKDSEDFPSLADTQKKASSALDDHEQHIPEEEAKKTTEKTFAVIDDDEAFPSLREEEAKKKAAQSEKNKKKAGNAQPHPLRKAAKSPSPPPSPPPKEEGSYLERLSSAWRSGGGAPRSLAQVSASLQASEAFPSLPAAKGPPVKGAWALRQTAQARASQPPQLAFAVTEPGQSAPVEGLDWLRATETKPNKNSGKKEKKAAEAKVPVSSMVAVGTKTKARLVARAKQGALENANSRPEAEGRDTPTPPPGFASIPLSSDVSSSGDWPKKKGRGGEDTGPPPGFASLAISTASSQPGPEIPPPHAPPPNGYTKPKDFKTRNRALLQKLWAPLSASDMEEFKRASGKFRSGELDGASYRGAIQALLGSNQLRQLLPELIALLPDVGRQSELAEASKELLDGGRNGSGWGGVARGALEKCSECGQFLQSWDAPEHISSHRLDGSFPQLGS